MSAFGPKRTSVVAPKWLTAIYERYSTHYRPHRRLAPADWRALARLRLISCLSFPKLKSGVGLVGQRGRTPSGRHQSLAGESPGRSAACLDLFGRLPAMDWHRWRLCCDSAKSGRSATTLSPHGHSDFGCIQSANGIGPSDTLSACTGRARQCGRETSTCKGLAQLTWRGRTECPLMT